MKLIELTRGAKAEVDDADFEYLDQWDWHFDGGSAYRPSRRHPGGRLLMQDVLAPIGFDPAVNRVSHVNGDRLDNRRSNLTLVPKGAERVRNSSDGVRVDNSSGYPGVNQWGNRWRARLQWNGDRIHLGVFETPELAHEAILEARRKLSL